MVDDAGVTVKTAAGVPFVAVPPQGGPRSDAPVVVAWHLLDPPRTEAAMAAALPLSGLDAWRVYLGLPDTGSRAPAGGSEELFRRAAEDAVLGLHGPISSAAAAEFPATLAELRDRLGLGGGPLALLGGSLGAEVVQLVLLEGDLDVAAVVLVSPVVRLRPSVDALSRSYGTTYAWSDGSLAVADRVDLVARADEVVRRGEPAVLLVVGEEDARAAFVAPAREARDALAQRYSDPQRVRLVCVPDMAHALADEPGDAARPQTAHAAQVDRLAVAWLQQHLGRV